MGESDCQFRRRMQTSDLTSQKKSKNAIRICDIYFTVTTKYNENPNNLTRFKSLLGENIELITC